MQSDKSYSENDAELEEVLHDIMYGKDQTKPYKIKMDCIYGFGIYMKIPDIAMDKEFIEQMKYFDIVFHDGDAEAWFIKLYEIKADSVLSQIKWIG